ncbi:acyltransferase [Bosea vestrisii]|uniref:acyltransferase family protein n=1 Tax=Bosea vestrisii TaxID=151416 RepID=UPI0024DFA97A|nr:acyltransferase [Bosea vestrisii]WID94957.1 acyltransferase [Bosea vestrisii]
MSPATTPQRYANLDALRAIAALAVMVEHMFGDLLRQAPSATGPMSTLAQSVVQNMSLGRFGVALFFLISGFVVPFSIGGERPLRRFAVSRLFRLYPALWLALAVLTTTAWLAGETPRTATVLANMTMAPPLFCQPWLSPIHWTLFVELLFYVLVALLFSTGALKHVGVLLALSLALIAATVLPVQLRMRGVVNLPIQYLGMHLSFLFLGLLLRLWLVERMRGARLSALVLVLVQLAALLSVSPFSLARGDNFVMEGLRPVLSAYMLAFVVFLAAIRLDRPRSPLLAGIGLTSYSMYLFHGTVNAAVYRVLPLTGELRDIATMLVCTGSTLLVSWFVYRTVERPMISLGHRISSKRNALPVPSSRFADTCHRRAEWNGALIAAPVAIQGAPPHPSPDYRAVRLGDGRSPESEPSSPLLSDIAGEAAREASVSDNLVSAILGTAMVAVTLSWFALLGYVGWKIAESL